MKTTCHKLLLVSFLVLAARVPAQNFVPGGIDSIGLSRLVPDTIVYQSELNSLGNWEPYTSVLGNSVFLVTANTYAEGSTTQQRYGLVFQPAGGGTNVAGDIFFADSGAPFRGPINASSQDFGPARVAGDKRPGANSFITGAIGSPHAFAEFQSDNRFNIPNLYSTFADARYGCVQTFRLDLSALAQSSTSNVIDAANGRLTSGTPSGKEITRFGGDVVGLDNGNFVAVVEDRSNLRNPTGRAVVAVILKPDGAIVKDSFVVENNEIWANVVAYRGGFAVRVGKSGIIYFFDNEGNAKGQINHTNHITLDPALDRGDENRLGAHINSPFVYLASRSPLGDGNLAVRIAVFDSRDQSFVTATNVTELTAANGGSDPNDFIGPAGFFGRVTVAVDARDRVAVVFGSKPAGYGQEQGTARVLAFDPATKRFRYLTKSFFVFINNHPEGGIKATTSSVSMTTRQICISAKGEINSTNNPAAGTDTPSRVNYYTVISHPDPQDDPTSTATGGEPRLSIAKSQDAVVISWSPDAVGFILESSADLPSPSWTVVGAQNPATIPIGSGNRFFRLRK